MEKKIAVALAIAMAFAPSAVFAELPRTQDEIQDAVLVTGVVVTPQILAVNYVASSVWIVAMESQFILGVAGAMILGPVRQDITAPEKFGYYRWEGQPGVTGERRKWDHAGAYKEWPNSKWLPMKRYNEPGPGVAKIDHSQFPFNQSGIRLIGEDTRPEAEVNWITRSGPNQG